MNLKNLKILFCSLIYFFTVLNSWSADGSIEARNNEKALLPLGYLQFEPEKRSTPNLPQPIVYIIVNDLYYNGQSQLIPLEGQDSVSLKNLQKKSVPAYITGIYQYKKSKFILTCILKDTKTKKIIWSKTLTANAKNFRQVAHQFSDTIVENFFGNKGFAQSKIAFISKENGHKELYLLDYDGKNPIQLTNDKSINLIPTWGKNNDYIIYTSYKTKRPQLFSYQISTKKNKLFLASKYLSLSPDYNSLDNELIYTLSINGNSEIFRSHWDSPSQTRITYSRSIETTPSWSPNGYEFAFTSNRAGSPQIYTMDKDGSNLKRLSYENSYNTSPAWSPSGDLIVFVGIANKQTNIYTIKPNGQDLRQLTKNSNRNENPTWSPNGKAIIFSSTRFGKNELFIMKWNGDGQKRIYRKHSITPSWSN